MRKLSGWVMFLVASFLPLVSAAFESEVRFAIRAFIPSAHPEISDYIKKTDKGTFVVPAPVGSSCYESDNRLFSSSDNTSSRVSVNILLKVSDRDMVVVDARKVVGETKKVDCVSGLDLEAPKRANDSTVTVGEVKKDRLSRTLFFRAATPNPFFLIAPKIDFSGYIKYDVLRRTITVKGMTGYFPSYEAYYSVNGGGWVKVVNLPPYKDSTAWSLTDFNMGINTRNFEGSIDLRP
ncbi:hypothetical protein FQZ97_657050 [compost metagenome]